jgi:hypothetical protein
MLSLILLPLGGNPALKGSSPSHSLQLTLLVAWQLENYVPGLPLWKERKNPKTCMQYLDHEETCKHEFPPLDPTGITGHPSYLFGSL